MELGLWPCNTDTSIEWRHTYTHTCTTAKLALLTKGLKWPAFIQQLNMKRTWFSNHFTLWSSYLTPLGRLSHSSSASLQCERMRNTFSVIYSSSTLHSTEMQWNLRVTFCSARKIKIDFWGELFILNLEASLNTMFEDVMHIIDDNHIKLCIRENCWIKQLNPFPVKTDKVDNFIYLKGKIIHLF